MKLNHLVFVLTAFVGFKLAYTDEHDHTVSTLFRQKLAVNVAIL